MDVIIRESNLEDLPVISNELLSSVFDTYSFYDRKMVESWSSKRFDLKSVEKLHYSENSTIFVVEHEKEIVGFGYVKITGEEEARMGNLYIYPNFRRKGIAQKLVDKRIEWCQNKNIKTLAVDVAEPNIKSQKLLLSKGFQIMFTVPGKVMVGTTWVEMKLDL